MTEHLNQQEIIKIFQQEIQRPLQFIYNFLLRNEIETITETNINKAVERVEKNLIQLERQLGKPVRKEFDERGIQINIYKNLSREKSKKLTDEIDKLNLEKALLENLSAISILMTPKDKEDGLIFSEGKVVKRDRAKLSKQQNEILKVSQELGINIFESEITNGLCLQIGNKINTKSKNSSVKIATVRKQVEKIIHKQKHKA